LPAPVVSRSFPLLPTLLSAQTKSGAVHTGVFAGAVQPDGKSFGVSLRFASTAASGGAHAASSAPPARPLPALTVAPKDFASLTVASLRLCAPAPTAATEEFATDAAIGAKRTGRAGRALVAWQPEEGDAPAPHLSLSSDAAPARGGGGGRSGGAQPAWDQFAANNAAFGVVSTFDENLYTTVLDKSKLSGISDAEAERLAREIEGKATKNFHLAEERGQAVGADDDDEEARFSSVLRGGAEGGVAGGMDASNEDTFGEHTPKSLDDKAPPAPQTSAAADASSASAEKPKSALNPNAKPFSFNPSATSFVPGGAAAAAAAAGTAAGTSAAAAAMQASFGFGSPGARGMPVGAGAPWSHNPRSPPYMGMAQMAHPMGGGGYPMLMPGMMGMPGIPGQPQFAVPMGYAPQAWGMPGGARAPQGAGQYGPGPGMGGPLPGSESAEHRT